MFHVPKALVAHSWPNCRDAARVQNGYARLGTGGYVRPPREFKNLPVSSEKVPPKGRDYPRFRVLSS
jgi:hypothetical protein